MRALHVQFKSFTASYRHPLLISGTQISTSVPSYSTLLGLIGACTGKQITPNDTRIGFEYSYISQDLELEKTIRWKTSGNKIIPHPKGQGILKRQIHFYPTLDLYVTNLDLEPFFKEPIGTPCLGRSQDVAWITLIKTIELKPVKKGAIGYTLVPTGSRSLPGLTLRLPEWFENTVQGEPRKAGPFGFYKVTGPKEVRVEIEMENLYIPSDANNENQVIYLHDWIKEN